jgi:hypothetical protein
MGRFFRKTLGFFFLFRRLALRSFSPPLPREHISSLISGVPPEIFLSRNFASRCGKYFVVASLVLERRVSDRARARGDGDLAVEASNSSLFWAPVCTAALGVPSPWCTVALGEPPVYRRPRHNSKKMPPSSAMKPDAGQSIWVGVRVRPPSTKEREAQGGERWRHGGNIEFELWHDPICMR